MWADRRPVPPSSRCSGRGPAGFDMRGASHRPLIHEQRGLFCRRLQSSCRETASSRLDLFLPFCGHHQQQRGHNRLNHRLCIRETHEQKKKVPLRSSCSDRGSEAAEAAETAEAARPKGPKQTRLKWPSRKHGEAAEMMRKRLCTPEALSGMEDQSRGR